ncbi:MAG: hypothetical protein WDZ89_03270, partial [Gemmatimonadota bacterium]
QHLEVNGAWQVILALHDTEGALLGNVAEGWEEPHHFPVHDPSRCPDPNVVLVRELDAYPTDPEAIRTLALELGGRIEDAWGIKERRFLARAGTAVGKFNARGWRRY